MALANYNYYEGYRLLCQRKTLAQLEAGLKKLTAERDRIGSPRLKVGHGTNWRKSAKLDKVCADIQAHQFEIEDRQDV